MVPVLLFFLLPAAGRGAEFVYAQGSSPFGPGTRWVEAVAPEMERAGELDVWGVRIRDEGERRVLWSRVVGGRLFEAVVKMRGRETVRLDGAQSPKLVIPPRRTSAQIEAIRFAPDLSRIYVYVKNVGRSPLVPSGVRLNGWLAETRTRSALAHVPPRGLGLFVVDLEPPARSGQLFVVEMDGADGRKVAGWARAFSGFGLYPELFVREPSKYGLDDATTFERKPKDARHAPAAQRYNLAITCPTHRHGDRAIEIAFEREREFRRLDPEWPVMVHVCMFRREEGLGTFGPIGDVLRFNPQSHCERSLRQAREHPIQRWVERARISCRPRRLFVLLPACVKELGFRERYPSPKELRFAVLCSLSRGASGICYRNRAWHATEYPQELRDEVGRTNRMLAPLREMLAVSCPDGKATCTDPKVEANVLRAGENGLVVVVLNRDYRGHLYGRSPPVFKGKRKLRVEVVLPPELTRRPIGLVGTDETGGRCSVRVDERKRAAVLVLPRLEVGTVVGLAAAGPSNCSAVDPAPSKAVSKPKQDVEADTRRPALIRLHELRRRFETLERWMRLGPSRPGFDDHSQTWVEEYGDIALKVRDLLEEGGLGFERSKQGFRALVGCLKRLGRFSESEEALDSLAALVSGEKGGDAGAELLIGRGESARSAGLRGLAVSRFDRAGRIASSAEAREHAAYFASLVCRGAGLNEEWQERASLLAKTGVSGWAPKATTALAERFLRSREYAKAEATYRLLLERFGETRGADALLGLGAVLEAKGDAPGALRMWRKLLADYPESPLAKAARARIRSASGRIIDWLEED